MKFESFQKSKIDLGFRNKNMHAMKCNLSNYSKFSSQKLGHAEHTPRHQLLTAE
jgi:hypothetical protein